MKIVTVALVGTLLVACGEPPSPKAAPRDPLPVLPSTPVAASPSASARAQADGDASAVGRADASGASTAATGECSSPDPKRTIASHDGHTTVFVAVDPSKTVATSVEDAPHEDICVSRDGGPPKVLVRGHAAGPNESVERTLASFGPLVFSLDDTLLFFGSAAWVTSGAAHVVELATGKERFLFDGAIEAAIVSGRDKGAYLASHYRLDDAHPISSPKYRGRIVSWSVVSKDGKTLRKLSESEAKRIAGTELGGVTGLDPDE